MLVPEEQQRSARSPQPPAHLRSASPANALTEQLRRRRQLGRDGLARGDRPPPPEQAVDSYQPPSLILSFFLGLGLIYAVLSVLIWVYSRPYLALDALFGVAALFASGPVMRWLQTVVPRRPPETRNEPGEFGLWIGEATGAFASMGHLAGIQAGANITLNLPDAAKNIAIFGETGTGKTTRVINHLLVQALDFDCGALIFDVRGDFYATARAAAQLGGKTIQRIGVDALGLNLLDGLTPNTAAGFLESAFRLLGQGHGDSGFWLSLAVARCQNALGVLEHVPGGHSLKALYQFVFDERFRTQAIEAGARALLELQTHEGPRHRALTLAIRRLRTALDYEAAVVPNYAEKERSGINRTIETALSRFTDPELEDAFCTTTGPQARLSDLLDGTLFIVNVPRERFKAAATSYTCSSKNVSFKRLTRASLCPRAHARRDPFCFSAMNTSKSLAPATPISSIPHAPSVSSASLRRSRSRRI